MPSSSIAGEWLPGRFPDSGPCGSRLPDREISGFRDPGNPSQWRDRGGLAPPSLFPAECGHLEDVAGTMRSRMRARQGRRAGASVEVEARLGKTHTRRTIVRGCWETLVAPIREEAGFM